MDLSKKVVLITGGTGGLGSAVTAAFLKAGSHVIVTYTKKEKYDLLNKDLGKLAKNIKGYEVNVIDEESVKAMADELDKEIDRIDILINLVGGFIGGKSVKDTTVEQWDRMMDLNLKSAFLCSKYVWPLLEKNNLGRIVNIGSKAGLQGAKNRSAYGASKAAVINLTKALAEEGKPFNITANLIVPSIIDTPDNRKGMPDANFEDWVKPETIAEVILFLSSDAGKDINGAVIPVLGKVG